MGAGLPLLVALLTRSAGWTLLAWTSVGGAGLVVASLASRPLRRRVGVGALLGSLALAGAFAIVAAHGARNLD